MPVTQKIAIVEDSPVIPVSHSIGRFGASDLKPVDTFTKLVKQASDFDGEDCIFRNAPMTPINLVPGGMVKGFNLFGPGTCSAVLLNPTGVMRDVSTAALHDVIISGQSTTVHSICHGFYEPTVRLIAPKDKLSAVAALEPFYKVDVTGDLYMDNLDSIQTSDFLAVPICGTGFHNYGHFLYDGLPAALQARATVGNEDMKLVSNRLKKWQKSILHSLGLLHLHQEVIQPVRFSRALVSDLLSLHVSYPTRFIRPVFDLLRFRHGGDISRKKRTVMFSRAFDIWNRVLVNRAAMERALADAGVEIFSPEMMSVPDQIALAASASLVIGESGSALANVGFCDPGAAVLEIQHEAGPDGWTRGACRMLGLHWHLYVAETDETALKAYNGRRPQGVFRVDIPSLVEAIRRIQETL